jgi:catalase
MRSIPFLTSIAWPESRKLVKLGTFTLTKLPTEPETAQKQLLFLRGQTHPCVEAADPMPAQYRTSDFAGAAPVMR